MGSRAPVASPSFANMQTGTTYPFYADFIDGFIGSSNGLDYQWTVTPPSGAMMPPSMFSGKSIQFTPCYPGNHLFQIRYNGACGWSAYSSKTININGQILCQGALSLTMYPNPASDQITVEWQESLNTEDFNYKQLFQNEEITISENDFEVVIYDSYAMEKSRGISTNGKIVLNTTQFKPGLYYVRASQGENFRSFPLIIEKK